MEYLHFYEAKNKADTHNSSPSLDHDPLSIMHIEWSH